jgi:chromosome segregation ATPase
MRGTANWRGARSVAAVVAVLPLLIAATARADDASEADKLREQLRATVMQLRELQDQQAAAKAASPTPAQSTPAGPDTAALKARLAAAQLRLRAVQHDAADAAAARADADRAKADLAMLQTSAAATQAELDKFRAAFNQASDQGRSVAAERDQLKSRLATETTIAQACQAKNERLTTFAEGLLDRYDHITLGEKLMAREPAIGFTRVHLENIAQEREDTIRASHCDPRVDALPARPATK